MGSLVRVLPEHAQRLRAATTSRRKAAGRSISVARIPAARPMPSRSAAPTELPRIAQQRLRVHLLRVLLLLCLKLPLRLRHRLLLQEVHDWRHGLRSLRRRRFLVSGHRQERGPRRRLQLIQLQPVHRTCRRNPTPRWRRMRRWRPSSLAWVVASPPLRLRPRAMGEWSPRCYTTRAMRSRSVVAVNMTLTIRAAGCVAAWPVGALAGGSRTALL